MSYSNTSLPRIVCHITSLPRIKVNLLFNTKVLSYFSTKNMSYSNTSLPRIVCHYQEYYCTSLPRIWRRRFRSFVYTPSTNNLPTVWDLLYTYWPIACGYWIELVWRLQYWPTASVNFVLIETTQPPIKYPQVMGQYGRPHTGGFCPRLPCAGRRHSSRVSSFRVDPCDRWLLKSLWCRQHRAYGYFLPRSIDFL